MAERATIRPDWSPPGMREPEEIARILDFRADRALRFFERAAREGPDCLCPICGYQGRFAPVRHKPSIWCPQCDSRPRHRLLKLWFDRGLRLAEGASVLHFAAESWVRVDLEQRGARYRSADITDQFDLQLDMTTIELPEASVDMVIANHVLEHVDDAKALAEIHRILRPGGQALLTVPMVEGWDETYEDASLDKVLRTRRYGDPDHLRFYGQDLRDRIRAAGFTLSEFAATEPDVSTHALHRGERIFIGTKPLAGASNQGATDG
ncbi:MAG: methyltransferase domain-containing protein [Pseudomonadota bacterium]